MNLRIFESSQFGKIRTSVTESGEPLFCLVDVCRILGLTNPSQVKTTLQQCGVISNEVSTPIISQGVNTGKSKTMELNFITEPNLYKCIFQSRKQEAEAFQDWVCGEVLPSIRKNGGYMVAKEDESPEEIMARALLLANETLKRQRLQIKAAEHRISTLEENNQTMESLIKTQADKIEEMTPGDNFARAVLSSNQSILVGEMATILTQNGCVIGRDRLFNYLREHGYLHKMGEQRNLPVQRYTEMGLFEIKKQVITRPEGDNIIRNTTKITPKGQIYLYNKLMEEGGRK